MTEELDNKELASIRDSAGIWFQNPVHTDRFREKAAETAALISLHLQGQGDDALCAAAIEELMGPLAQAEVTRLAHCQELDRQMLKAYQESEAADWIKAFIQVLPMLSEAQQFALMVMVSEEGLYLGDPIDDVDQALVHDMPETAQ